MPASPSRPIATLGKPVQNLTRRIEHIDKPWRSGSASPVTDDESDSLLIESAAR